MTSSCCVTSLWHHPAVWCKYDLILLCDIIMTSSCCLMYDIILLLSDVSMTSSCCVILWHHPAVWCMTSSCCVILWHHPAVWCMTSSCCVTSLWHHPAAVWCKYDIILLLSDVSMTSCYPMCDIILLCDVSMTSSWYVTSWHHPAVPSCCPCPLKLFQCHPLSAKWNNIDLSSTT